MTENISAITWESDSAITGSFSAIIIDRSKWIVPILTTYRWTLRRLYAHNRGFTSPAVTIFCHSQHWKKLFFVLKRQVDGMYPQTLFKLNKNMSWIVNTCSSVKSSSTAAVCFFNFKTHYTICQFAQFFNNSYFETICTHQILVLKSKQIWFMAKIDDMVCI